MGWGRGIPQITTGHCTNMLSLYPGHPASKGLGDEGTQSQLADKSRRLARIPGQLRGGEEGTSSGRAMLWPSCPTNQLPQKVQE